jgi:cytoskeletal protein CcmA (bactofilin family)
MFKRKQTLPNVTYLAEGSNFQGNLRTEGGLRIDGQVHGTVEVGGDLEVSATGTIEGPEVKAHNIFLQGAVKGNVIASGTLSLSRTARLEGDVIAASLNIEMGAFYVGHIVTQNEPPPALPSAPAFPKLVGRSDD